MKIIRPLFDFIVKITFFVNSISARIIAFIIVRLLGRKKVKKRNPRKRFK